MSQAKQARVITAIPATIQMHTQMPLHGARKRRVAAYARVSTDSEEQQTSYDAQVDHYTRYIENRQDWTFVGMYADEGITGTSTKRRNGFNRMIQDAIDGKMDLIIAKSVSRFARNTVDSLNAVRLLKDKGVEIFFEKEAIYTLDSKGEFLITLMSSLAQEESRSISENVTWGQRKRFVDGRYSLPYKQFLGYQKGSDGFPEIVEQEAEVVRAIYGMYLDGKTPGNIAKTLTEAGIPTPANKVTWQSSTITSILKNEKYKGEAILQKTFTVDFLTKKIKQNEGEVPQVHVTGSHPAIIEPEIFERVQQETQRRKKLGRAYSGNSCFASRIVCGECGGLYGSKVWYSNTKYRRTIWRCNQKYENDAPCGTPHFSEDQIKSAFVDVFNQVLDKREEIVAACREAIEVVMDTSGLDREREKLIEQLVGLNELMRRHIEQNAHEVLDQAAYIAEYEELAERFQKAEDRIAKIDGELRERRGRRTELEAYLSALVQAGSLLAGFDERLWVAMVEIVTVYDNGRFAFRFRDGLEIQWD